MSIGSFPMVVLRAAFILFFSWQCLAADISFEVPVLVNGTEQGDLEITIQGADIYVEKTALFTKIESLLEEKFHPILASKEDFLLLPLDFEEKIWVYFSEQDQELTITIDLLLLKKKKSSLSKRQTKEEVVFGDVTYPADSSAYCNWSFTGRRNHDYFLTPGDNGNLYGSADFCFNYKDWILQGFAYFANIGIGSDTGLSTNINRGNIFLTKDRKEYFQRFILGDIHPNRVSFQNAVPLLGLNFSRNPNIFGKFDPNIGPAGQYEFFLNTPSTLEVYVNNVFIKKLELPAGPQLLENFPFANGVNDVDLKITSASGETSVLNLNYFFSSEILPKGSYNYSFSLGFPRFQRGSSKYKYLLKEPAFSTCAHLGISDHLSGSFYLQATKDTAFAGTAILHINHYLSILSELGGSYSQDSFGFRGKCTLTNAHRTEDAIHYNTSIDLTSKKFSGFFLADVINPIRAFFNFSFAIKLWGNISWKSAASYGIAREGFIDSNSFSTSLLMQPRRGVNANATLSYKRLDNGKPVWEGVFSMHFYPFDGCTSSGRYNTRTNTLYTDFSYGKSLSYKRSLKLKAGYTKVDDVHEGTGSLRYDGYRSELHLEHYLYQNALLSQNAVSRITRVNFRTALVYAGGMMSISRPVYSNFILFPVSKALRPYTMNIYAKDNNEPLASSGYLPAVITNIPDYNITKISVSSLDLPTNYDLNDSYAVSANYKSAFIIPIQERGVYVNVEGCLLDGEGTPFRYANFSLTSPSGEYHFFTNSLGLFSAFHVPPGTYELFIEGKDHEKIILDIFFEGEEFLQLGEIVVRVLKEKSQINLKKKGS